MNTLHETPPPLDSEAVPEHPPVESKITGFDGGTRSLWKQPSFFLSVALIILAMAACFGSTLHIFALAASTLIGLAVILHIVADKCLTRANNNLDLFSLPFEGVLVVTFGSILPGLGLLAYGLYTLLNSSHSNVLDVLGKLALLLVVPIFNFSVWAAIRRRYIIRPRLTGMMNGFAIGLSASWTAIWIKSVLMTHGSDTKFGWMLLLFLSPALLFSAVCLSVDLQRKTEQQISRITTTFSALGCLLSLLFVFAPIGKSFYVQSLLKEVLTASPSEQQKQIANIQAQATLEDLRPAKHPVSGFALASLLLGNNGLDNGSNAERNLYFKITGNSFDETLHKSTENDKDGEVTDESLTDPDLVAANAVVGSKIVGLSLAKSQLVGKIDAPTMSAAVDWSMTFHNATNDQQEASSVISMPENAVVSRVTLWINGEAREAAFAHPAKTQAAYDEVQRRSRDPLLVTMIAPDKILLQCFPVAANTGDMKIRIGFKLALKTKDGKSCTMDLPRLLARNYAQSRRRQIQFTSSTPYAHAIPGGAVSSTEGGYVLTARPKDSNISGRTKLELSVTRDASLEPVAVMDAEANPRRYIIEQLKHVTKTAPKKLVIVVDSSGSMRGHASDIRKDIAAVSTSLKPLVYFVNNRISDTGKTTNAPPISAVEAQSAITDGAFKGGKDNGPALTDALELVTESKDGAVLWIHGPQPVVHDLSELTTLDMVNPVHLYDLQIEPGQNEFLRTLPVIDPSGLISHETIGTHANITNVGALVTSWKEPEERLAIARTISTTKPNAKIIDDPVAAIQVARIWVKDKVTRLLADGNEHEALLLAQKYRIISPVTGAVVLGDATEYKRHQLDPGFYKDTAGGAPTTLAYKTYTPSSIYYGGGGLVGAPVDPRYGQSNDVGRMSDFSYDTARDITHLVIGISLLISLFIAFSSFRSKKSPTGKDYLKALFLVFITPTVVHLLGTYLINNFGGLGGGL